MSYIFVRKLVLANQRSEQCFFWCEKNDTSNQKPQRCASFAPKFPPFIAACSAASHTFNEKVLLKEFFSLKSEKHSEMEWNSFVCFTVDKENGKQPAKQQRKGINRTRRKLLLCFLSVYNKHNTRWKVLCTVFTHSLFLYQKSYSFAALTRSISDTSTTRP